MNAKITRRTFLGAAATVAGTTLVTAAGPVASAQAISVPQARPWSGPNSSNGWPILDQFEEYAVEGSGLSVQLAPGDAAVILTHIARRFHYEIDQLRIGDLFGGARSFDVAQSYESNYLSGSALAIRPLAYPVGAKGGLYPQEIIVVRDILAELDGALAWGGDFSPPKESHFELAYPPDDVRIESAARRLTSWRDRSNAQGAGATDAFNPQRQAAAKVFAATGG